MANFNKKTLHAALFLILSSQTAFATNGDQMTALSAPTAAMGGATVAAPRDALTVLYNPAGLAHLVGPIGPADKSFEEVRVDFGFGLLNPVRSVNGRDSDSNLYLIPSGGIAFNVNNRLFVGMGMAGVSGQGVNVDDIAPLPGNQQMVTTKQVFRLSPAFAYRVTDQFTIGGSLNFGYQSLALSNPNFSLPQNQEFGFGASLGAIYKINDRLQLGAAYTSKIDIHEMEFNTSSGKVSFDMDVPASYALGVAFKPMDGLLVEFDVKQILFSDTMDRIAVNRPAGSPYPTSLNFGWSDQTVYALGVRKKVNQKTVLLLGLNYGKSPIESNDVANNLGSTAVVETHASIGITRKLSKHVRGNIAYTRAFNKEVSDGVRSIEMNQNQLNTNITYTF